MQLKTQWISMLWSFIPTSFARFRESPDSSDDYNLHDAIKLYAADKGISVQFIEERSTNAYDTCKVLWGLSTSLYAKSQGILWHLDQFQMTRHI